MPIFAGRDMGICIHNAAVTPSPFFSRAWDMADWTISPPLLPSTLHDGKHAIQNNYKQRRRTTRIYNLPQRRTCDSPAAAWFGVYAAVNESIGDIVTMPYAGNDATFDCRLPVTFAGYTAVPALP